MLHATSQTALTNHVAPRPQATRDSTPRASGFSELLATEAPKQQRRLQDTNSSPRNVASERTRDSQEPDDRATPDADHPSATPATDTSPGQAEPAEASSDKPAKSVDDTASTHTADPSAPASDGFDPTAVLVTTAAAPAPADNPIAVVVAAPLVPQAIAQPAATISVATISTAPLAIAAAAIATAKPAPAKASIAEGETDATEEPSSAPPVAATDAVQVSAAGTPQKVAVSAPTIATNVETAIATSDDAKLAVPVQPSASAVHGKPESKPANPAAAPAAATSDKPDAASASTPSVQPKGHEARAAQAAAAEIAVATDVMPLQPQASAQTALNLTPAAAPLPTIIATSTAPVPLAGLAVELAAKAQDGVSRFEIRLDPADLGRIDVRIDVDKQGQVTSHLTVEKAETLAMLRQDAPQLQRALNDAGLKTADGALQFTLGDQSQPQRHTDSGDRQAQHFIVREDDTAVTPIPMHSYGRLLAARGGIDISV